MGHTSGSLFGFASGGVYLAPNDCSLAGALLPHPFTLTYSPNKLEKQAVSSLLHLSLAHATQALPGTLPVEARTFLPFQNCKQ